MPPILPRLILALAAMPLGRLAAQGFTELTSPQGVPAIPHANLDLGTGVCAADLDGDGDLDIVVAPAVSGSFVVLRNDGNMMFTDISATAGLGSQPFARCVQAADIDNDGDQDIYAGNFLQPGQLFINDGTGVFTEEAALRGIIHTDDNFGASFGDFDRDGWLDLYLGCRWNQAQAGPSPNRLYRNTGNGYFVDVTASSGAAGLKPTLACAFFDFDEDGWPDLIDVVDKKKKNDIYRNNGDGTFTSVGQQYGADIAIDGMGFDFLDVFNDGGVDFYCSDLPTDHLFQLWDPVGNTYVDATATYGLQGGYVGWASNYLDYDNDGWQDLYVVHLNGPNAMFRNPGAPAAAQAPWPNVAGSIGLNQNYWQYSSAMGDFDNDGRVDVLQRFFAVPPMAPTGLSLYRNETQQSNWLKFRTEGTVSNRDGLGARIEVLTGSHRQRQWVRSGVGYVGDSDRRVHFGLGASSSADFVTISWPSGQRQHLTGVSSNQIVHVVEPRMTVSGPAPIGGSTTISTSIPGDQGLPYVTLLSLSANSGIALPDGNVIPIDQDVLTDAVLTPGNPILPGSVGFLDAAGTANVQLNVPPLPFLSGLRVYAASVTIDAPRFPIVRTCINRALEIIVQ